VISGSGSLRLHARRVCQDTEGSESRCTEDALLNVAGSYKDILRHNTEVNNSGRRPVRLLNTSGGKAV
jgi:hypothetical protein